MRREEIRTPTYAELRSLASRQSHRQLRDWPILLPRRQQETNLPPQSKDYVVRATVIFDDGVPVLIFFGSALAGELLTFVDISTLPRKCAPSAIATRGAVISPSTEPLSRMLTFRSQLHYQLRRQEQPPTSQTPLP